MDVANNDFAGLPVDADVDADVDETAICEKIEVVEQQPKWIKIKRSRATKKPNSDLKVALESCKSVEKSGVGSIDKKFLVATQQADLCGGFDRCLNIALQAKSKLVSGMCPKCAEPYLEESSGSLSTCEQCGSCVEAVPGCQYNPLALFFQ